MERRELQSAVRPRVSWVLVWMALVGGAGFVMEHLSVAQAMHVAACLWSANPGGCDGAETGGFDI